MKKIFSFLSIFIILVMLLGVKTDYAVSETNVWWTANKTQLIPGQTFTVTLSANCDDGLNGIYTKYTYDSNVLELQNAAVVDTTNWSDLGGDREIALLTSKTTIYNTNLYKLTFKVKENATTGSTTSVATDRITLSTFGADKTFDAKSISISIIPKQITSIAMKTNPNTLTYKQKYGTLNLTGGVLIATYNDGSTKEVSLTSSDVQVTGFSNTTPGEKTLTVTYGGKTTTFKVKILMLGDANSDNKVDINDIFEINKHRLNKKTLQGDQLLSADVNNDGKVDILDIFQMNKFRLGKISNL